MPACTPPPPPVHAIVREATALVSARVAPIATPTACMSSDIPAGSGMATPGVVWLPTADAAMLARPPRQWSPDRLTALLHEVLHQVGMERGLEEGGHMSVEEGAVEAVTHDLRPALMRRIGRPDAQVAVAYHRWVASVRTASARATGSSWTSSRARAWRATLLATPPRERSIRV